MTSALAGFVGQVVDADLEEAGVGSVQLDFSRVVRRGGRHVEVAEVEIFAFAGDVVLEGGERLGRGCGREAAPLRRERRP